jgi:hypothetical protein
VRIENVEVKVRVKVRVLKQNEGKASIHPHRRRL